MKKKNTINKMLIAIIAILVVILIVFGILLWKNQSTFLTRISETNNDNKQQESVINNKEEISNDTETTEDTKETKEAETTRDGNLKNTGNKEQDSNAEQSITEANNSQPVDKDKTNTNDNNTTIGSKVIVIDPGHQVRGNSAQEPIGPGATETKAKVTGGATGVSTGQTEYALNLKVALLLQQKLQAKGYTVIMTRTVNEVDMSNMERAQIANNANADAFIRIHANSLNDQSVKGVLTMCQTSNNPYNGYLADESYRLSKLVLDNVINKTGAINKGVTRTDTMSGINWCTVPTTIIEMGFLSNPEEDELMATQSYREKIVDGIIAGVEEFLK